MRATTYMDVYLEIEICTLCKYWSAFRQILQIYIDAFSLALFCLHPRVLTRYLLLLLLELKFPIQTINLPSPPFPLVSPFTFFSGFWYRNLILKSWLDQSFTKPVLPKSVYVTDSHGIQEAGKDTDLISVSSSIASSPPLSNQTTFPLLLRSLPSSLYNHILK